MSATASPRYVLQMAHARYLGGFKNSPFATWRLAATARVPFAGNTSKMHVWVRAPLLVQPPRQPCWITAAVQRLKDGTCEQFVDILGAAGKNGWNATEDDLHGWCVKGCDGTKDCVGMTGCVGSTDEVEHSDQGDDSDKRDTMAVSEDDETTPNGGGPEGNHNPRDAGKSPHPPKKKQRKRKRKASNVADASELLVEPTNRATEAAASAAAMRDLRAGSRGGPPKTHPPVGGSPSKARGRGIEQNTHYEIVERIKQSLKDALHLPLETDTPVRGGASQPPPPSAPMTVNILEHRIIQMAPGIMKRINDTDILKV